ncbi:MAG: GntR family transcriptional regulator [Anaerolinea sp.]|nr:GntR family transcriptional regulator [Anaerolinea sp.]
MSTPTLAEAVATAVRKDILDGKHLSGERLIELSIAHELNVSQITVRDALRILEQEGWVVKQPRRGVYVRSFTPENALEVFAVMEALELLLLEWLIPVITKAACAELGVLLMTARKHAHRSERREAITVLFAFHEKMGTLIDRPLTNHLLDGLRNQVRLLEAIRQARAPFNLRELHAQIDQHEAIVRALEAGDLAGAQQHSRVLYAAYRELMLSILRI